MMRDVGHLSCCISHLRSQVVSSKQPKLGILQELSFSRISESTTGYTFTPVWDILLPLTQTPDRRDHRLLVSLPKDTLCLRKQTQCHEVDCKSLTCVHCCCSRSLKCVYSTRTGMRLRSTCLEFYPITKSLVTSKLGKHMVICHLHQSDNLLLINYLHTDIYFKSCMYLYWRSLLYT